MWWCRCVRLFLGPLPTLAPHLPQRLPVPTLPGPSMLGSLNPGWTQQSASSANTWPEPARGHLQASQPSYSSLITRLQSTPLSPPHPPRPRPEPRPPGSHPPPTLYSPLASPLALATPFKEPAYYRPDPTGTRHCHSRAGQCCCNVTELELRWTQRGPGWDTSSSNLQKPISKAAREVTRHIGGSSNSS